MKNNNSSQSFRSNRITVVIILIAVAVFGALALKQHNPANQQTSAPLTSKEAMGQDFDTVWAYALKSGKENQAIRWGKAEGEVWGTVIPGITYNVGVQTCREYTIRTVTPLPAVEAPKPEPVAEGEPQPEDLSSGPRNETKIEYGRACMTDSGNWQKMQ
ncbi:MAG: hypothetical protein FJX23_05405 [Alphaproteobacteria bacterium]|nr:hypothetical protein [Alphaproteobacteria bacterium]